MDSKEYYLANATWGEVKQCSRYDLAILPWGATEPHNGHLPYGTDFLIAQAVGVDVARKANESGVNVMVLPGIPFGSQNPGQTTLPFCIHASQATQAAILHDVVTSLERQGIRRLIIMNGHGGNTFKGMIRDLAAEKPGFLIAECEYFSFMPHDPYFEENPDDHAGEAETSLIMHYYPSLVKMEYAGDGTETPFAIEGLRKKVAWMPRDWSKATKDTGVGNPHKSSAQKGKAYIEAAVKEIAALVVDLCRKECY